MSNCTVYLYLIHFCDLQIGENMVIGAKIQFLDYTLCRFLSKTVETTVFTTQNYKFGPQNTGIISKLQEETPFTCE